MSNPFEAASDRARPSANAERAELADPGIRFLARLVDNVAGFAGASPGVAILMATPSGWDSLDMVFIGLGVALLGYFAVSAYNWFLIATEGTTIGKRAMDLQIVSDDGSPIDFWRGVVLREWALGLASAALNFGLGGMGGLLGLVDSLMVFTDEHRTLHDRIAGTLVVRGRGGRL